jgi:predicted amidohydrolase
MSMRIAQIKVYPQRGDCAANQSRLLSLLDAVAAHQPDVVITPECFLDGYIVDSDITAHMLSRYAVDPDTAPEITAVQAWAAANQIWVIYGCMRQAAHGIYNTALIINRDGSLVGHYDKTHLQTHDLKFLAGQSLPVFASDFGTLGVLICADRRWPEAVRTLALQGARVIFNPTYGMHDARNRCMMQTRSWESEVVIAFTHPAQALITGPQGEIMRDESAPELDFVVTDIDLDAVDACRVAASAHLRDRRTDLYMNAGK